MTEETSLILSMPAMSIDIALQRRQAIVDFTKQVMVKSRDFGGVGGNKPTLLKPGAEKLSSLFGLWPDFESVEAIEDWTGNEHNEEAFFCYRYKCTMRRIEDNRPVGAGIGSCNSWERKYRFVKGKKRNNPQDIVNTIDKMAQKRALVAAVLIAVNASEFFTQDLEDYSNVVDGQWEPATNGPGTTAKPIAKPAPVAKKVEKALDTEPEPAPNGDELMAAVEWRSQVAGMLEYKDPMHLENTMKLYDLWPTPKTKETRQEAYKVLRRHRELRDNDHTEAETFEMVIKEYGLEVTE